MFGGYKKRKGGKCKKLKMTPRQLFVAKKKKVEVEDYPPHQCITRIMSDVLSIYDEPPPNLLVYQDDEILTKISALITGALDTPYEGGFFFFILKCPYEYPIKPPVVKFMTTGGGKIPFNPNLCRSGKEVCLSILGTWSGIPWNPTQTLSSTLISIQSLLCEFPYHNKPGFEKERYPADAFKYNNIIIHETLRVAVIGMLENNTRMMIPRLFRTYMKKTFLANYQKYNMFCQRYMGLQGVKWQDPFNEMTGVFDFVSIKAKLKKINAKLSKEVEKENAISTIDEDD